MVWARGQQAGGGAAKSVLRCLAERVDDVFYAWCCSVDELAAEVEMSTRNLHYAVAGLVRRGLLRVWRRGAGGRRGGGRRSNCYQLLVAGDATLTPPYPDLASLYNPDEASAAAQARVDARRADGSGDGADDEGKPANVAGLQTCKPCTFEPADLAGLSNKEGLTPGNNQPPPHPTAPPTAAAPAVSQPTGQVGQDIDEDRETQREAALRADLILGDVLYGEPPHRWPSRWQTGQLARLIAGAVDAGWTVRGLVRELSGNLATADDVYACLRYRLRNLGPPPLHAVPDPPRDPPPLPDAEPEPGGRPPGWAPQPYLEERPLGDPDARAAAAAAALAVAAAAREKSRSGRRRAV
jgi:hypothetical protein